MIFRICAILLLPCVLLSAFFEPLLLSDFDKQHSDKEWLVSEKLDGVRGLWDGERMYFRSGKQMDLPSAFIADFPPFALDGELYSPQKSFSEIISILKNRTKQEAILELSYYVFDVPNAKGGLLERLKVLESYLQTHKHTKIRIIPQVRFKGIESIWQYLQTIVDKGGEGLVLRDEFAPYSKGRSKKDFKLKIVYDTECEVVGISPGKGKYKGKAGAIICQAWGKQFKIGSGLNDKLRLNPPSIGSIISFKYYGLTEHKMPRFPIFWRVKEEE